ncbi:hypothetical protein N7492_000172 [Penicillium capsulatum]|uniref:Uncharacterized protein n=1 Tax=Penicillium capsulatum TaxID=69766 RepID=A0A9W9ISA4_9EURO|nr:hypothetical protein N7492_000172 [Penicillium capsulatum]KAJ6130763.1 hypothetical protein N7512_003543 [Penicillium capsulatum]
MGRLFHFPGAMRPRVFTQVRNYASGTEAIPTFSQTPSSELNQALDRFRQNVFIPAGLPQRQRMSMFKAKHAHRLEEEPITVNISETEQFTLRHMKMDELPTKRDAYKVFQMMTSTKEYKNLIPFLKGLWMSNYRISSDRWESLIRHAGPAGKLNLIIECAKQQAQTGLAFDNISLTRRLFFELHCMAQAADFKGPAAAQALGLAHTAVRTMEWNSSQTQIEASKDPKRQPFVIGTLLELSAARAVNEIEGKDEGAEVLKFVQKLLASWDLGQFEPVLEGKSRPREALDLWLQEVIPVYNGLQMSLLVKRISSDKKLSPIVTSRLQGLKDILSEHVQSADQAKPSRCLNMAKSLLSA